MLFDEMKTFHNIDETNPNSFAVPIMKDFELYTLDLDGSLI